MIEYWQWFTAVAIGGIVGWILGYCRGMKDERTEAIQWIRVVNERMDGALLREAKKMHTDITEEIEGIKR